MKQLLALDVCFLRQWFLNDKLLDLLRRTQTEEDAGKRKTRSK